MFRYDVTKQKASKGKRALPAEHMDAGTARKERKTNMIITGDMSAILHDTTMHTPVYLDVTTTPFSLHGFSEPFRRVPAPVAEKTSECVMRLSKVTAGGRVRFRTTSDFVVIHGELIGAEISANSAPNASQSFDIYVKEDGKHRFRGVFTPSQGAGKSYVESRLKFHNNDMKDIIVYFPLNSSFSAVYVGLREGAVLEAGSAYTHEKPVVFYGSSIVHGGGSKPSAPYSAVISRRLDTEFINLGFGGGARAEEAIIDYIATLDMSVFVYDYDHNAPDYDFLEKTHYEGYKRFRRQRPDVPVIMASRPDYFTRNFTLEYYTMADVEKRRALIESNYKRALAEGDRNVYFVDGSKIFPETLCDDCTSDGCHPNDLGYHFMANAFGAVIEKLL